MSLNLCSHIKTVFVIQELPLESLFVYMTEDGENLQIKEHVAEFECLFCPNCGVKLDGRGLIKKRDEGY